jgi:hypothetical protein
MVAAAADDQIKRSTSNSMSKTTTNSISSRKSIFGSVSRTATVIEAAVAKAAAVLAVAVLAAKILEAGQQH